MDDELLDHVMEARDKHEHDLARHLWLNLELLHIHEHLEVTAITVIHEHIVARVSLDSLLKLRYVFTVNCILILDFTDNQVFFILVQILSFDDLACDTVRALVDLLTR